PWLVAADDLGAFRASWVLVDDLTPFGFRFTLSAVGDVSGAAAPVEFWRVATVKTDKPQYQPGDVAHVSGEGFRPGEGIGIAVGHQHFALAGPATTTADAHGRFSTAYAIDAAAAVGTFRLEAAGRDTQLIAITGFDGPGTTVVYDRITAPPGGPSYSFFRTNFRRDVSPRVLEIVTAAPRVGVNAGSGVIFLDTNGNGFIDRRIDWYPAEFDLLIEPVKITTVTTCTDDSALGCQVDGAPTDLQTRSFFAIIGGRTMQSLAIGLPDLGLPGDGDEPRVINVCDADCVITPGSGVLTLEQVVPGGGTARPFVVGLESGAARNGQSSWTIVARPVAGGLAGSQPFISLAPGRYQLNAVVDDGWILTGAACHTAGAAGPGQFFPVTGPAAVALYDVAIEPGRSTRCKFVSEPRPAATTAP
ncbi:MAG: hypothetical protein R2708_29430, partial [Vicinamibacterales bacterium]